MKTLLCYAFLLVTIAYNVHDIRAISSLDDETYSTFLELLKGEFNVPLQQRSTKQKSAIVRFWRNRSHLFLQRGNVCFDGKPVLRKSTVSKVVAKAFKETKGSGVRKLYHHLKDVCSGVGEREVRCVLGKSRLHQRLNVRFQNKAILKPIRARTVQSRHQVDLVSMESTPVKRRGRAFKYVLSLLDVFSRYHWLVPLEGKRSSSIAKAMSTIYKEHGPPRVLQHDQGREFDGAVKKLCNKLGIKVIKGRPYHPQSQGKIERAHRSFKKKVMYDLLSMSNTGVNWVKCLPDYARTLNCEPKEELSWKSPFEVYYGRKPFRKNDISGASTAQEWNVDEEAYERLTSSLPKDYKSHELQVTRIRKAAALASKRCESRMIKKGLRNNPPSVYDIGEKVLIRHPTAKKLCSKRSVLPARVLKRNLRTCKYKVKFTFLAKSSNTLRTWISVNDITSTTMNKEQRKKKLARQSSKKKHRKKYFIPFSNQRKKFTDMQSKIHFLISFDPPKDGNCQFSAVCHELMKMGIFRSAETLRKEIVLFLESNPNSADGTPLELFSGTPWTQYLQLMARNGTFGDHITLQAIANLFNVQLVIYSTLGTLATQTITPVNGCPIATFYLGHFAEGAGEHYVCLVDDRQETSAANELNVSHSLIDEAEVPHGNQKLRKKTMMMKTPVTKIAKRKRTKTQTKLKVFLTLIRMF